MKRTINETPKSGHKKRKASSHSKEPVSNEQEEDIIIFTAEKTSSTQLSNGQIRQKACPWMAKKTTDIRDPLLRFHNEIIEFYAYIAATPAQRASRKQAFLELKTIIQEVVPDCEIKQFGSSASGLQLPDGDVDVTILTDREQMQVLKAVNNRLRDEPKFTRLDFRRGKVPIINVFSSRGGQQFDISVNKRDGLRQLLEIQRMIGGVPEFKYIFMVLKCMLKIRGYSETYHGYIGSYLLFCMVFQFLFHKYQGFRNFSPQHLLSQDIINFLQFYSGTDWSQIEVLVGRGIIRERSQNTMQTSKPGYLRFMSPQNPNDDIGGKAYKIKQVFYCFKNRVQVLKNKNYRRGESVLKELLNPSLQEFSYPNRHGF